MKILNLQKVKAFETYNAVVLYGCSFDGLPGQYLRCVMGMATKIKSIRVKESSNANEGMLNFNPIALGFKFTPSAVNHIT